MKEVASLADRTRKKEEVRKLENLWEKSKNPEFGSHKKLNRAVLGKRLRQAKTDLKRISPEPIAPGERSKLEKEAKGLEEEIREGMQAHDVMMGQATTGGGRTAFSGAVDRQVHIQRTLDPKKRRLKQLYRNLHPQDSDLPNLERLRQKHDPSKPSSTSIVNPGIPGLEAQPQAA